MKPTIFKLILFTAAALLLAACTAQAADGGSTGEVEFTLKSAAADGKLVYEGVGGVIDGLINPDLEIETGTTVRIRFLNEDGISHDLAVPEVNANTPLVLSKGDSQDLVLAFSKPGTYAYLCTVAGHRQAGMEGKLIVRDP
jgi:nitrite reductase (NO-forming)